LVIKIGVAAGISIGEGASNSVASQQDRARSLEQTAAENAIEQDPFIKNLKQDFGADINRASIRPLIHGPGN